MPQPRSINYGDRWLPVTGGFKVEWVGFRRPVLARAALWCWNDVARRTGLDVGHAIVPLRIDCRGEDVGQ